MIEIKCPYIKNENDKCYLHVDIKEDNILKHVWFCVDHKYGKYLCHERADAFVIGLLSYAMRNKHDIKCESPISETLYYQLVTYFIPSVSNNSSRLYQTKIIAPVCSEPLTNANAVGTGISGGIDSLSTIIEHIDTPFSHHNLTHLMFNNVGSHGCGEDSIKLYNIRLERIRNYCRDNNFELIETNSNFHEQFHQNHLLTHTYSSMFAVYILQKLFSVYYYSSAGHKFSDFSLKDNDLYAADNYEMFSLYMFSNDNLKLYSSCSTMSRLDKTKIVADYEPSYKYLDVCGLHPYSCMKCSKCIRTMFAFHILGKLNEYKNTFDVDYFYNHYKIYLAYFYAYYKAHKAFFDEMYPYVKKEITFSIKLKAIWLYRKDIIKKIFKR